MLYTNPSVPASFSGLAKFKQNHKNAHVGPIKDLAAYYMHKETPSVFPRCKTIVGGVDSEWQADLIDIKNKKHEKYLLTVIDVFSRYAYVEPLKNKTGTATAEALKKILKSNNPPKVFYTDSGNEFKGNCKTVYKEHNINHITAKSVHKAAVVERFNRTLRLKIERYLTFAKSNIFTNVLQDLVKSYNNTIHSAHDHTPEQVRNMNSLQKEKLREKMYNDIPFEDMSRTDLKNSTVNFNFKIGDYVRVVKDKKLFQKSSTFQKWSNEIFLIDELCPTLPPTYKIKRIDGKTLDWRYYKEELQISKPPEPKPEEPKRPKAIKEKQIFQPRRSTRLKK